MKYFRVSKPVKLEYARIGVVEAGRKEWLNAKWEIKAKRFNKWFHEGNTLPHIVYLAKISSFERSDSQAVINAANVG